jgi:hypothetical protein
MVHVLHRSVPAEEDVAVDDFQEIEALAELGIGAGTEMALQQSFHTMIALLCHMWPALTSTCTSQLT